MGRRGPDLSRPLPDISTLGERSNADAMNMVPTNINERLAQGCGLHGYAVVNEKASDDAAMPLTDSATAEEFRLSLVNQV